MVPAPDSVIYPWVYYLLGGKQQLAVYHGQQFDSTATRCGDGGLNRVYMYPFEYLSYGTNDVGMLITRPSGAKEYKVVDHLGSTRAVLNGSGAVIGGYDNEPFGAPLAVTGVDSRKGFIDKEFDRETSEYNVGVRQYDPATGGFGNVDMLWEKYRAVTPYQYGMNNPVRLADYNGMEVLNIIGGDAEQATRELDEATSLALTRDPNTGQITATGQAQTPADNMLLDAIEDNNIIVNLNTTQYPTFPSIDGGIGGIAGGAHDGSRINGGLVIAEQWVNLSQLEKIKGIGGGTVGENVLHEANEAYIGGQMFPGQTYSEVTYNAAHKATMAIGPPLIELTRVRDLRGGIMHVSLEAPNGNSVELYKYNNATGAIVP